MTTPRRRKTTEFVKAAAAAEHGECILWPFAQAGVGADKGEGYGKIYFEGRQTYSHIAACKLKHGPKPTPQHEAEHLCPRKLCCNGNHVQWALHSPNCMRRTEHGTQLQGEKHPMVKLTTDQVRAIRMSPQTGVFLASFYGVSTALISLIRSRKLWAHIE